MASDVTWDGYTKPPVRVPRVPSGHEVHPPRTVVQPAAPKGGKRPKAQPVPAGRKPVIRPKGSGKAK